MGKAKISAGGGPIRVNNGKIIKRLAATSEISANTFVQVQAETAAVANLSSTTGTQSYVRVGKCSRNRVLFAYTDYNSYVRLGVGTHNGAGGITIPTTWTKTSKTGYQFRICEYAENVFILGHYCSDDSKSYFYRVSVADNNTITITLLASISGYKGLIWEIVKVSDTRIAVLWGGIYDGMTLGLFSISGTTMTQLKTAQFLYDSANKNGADRGCMRRLTNGNLFVYASSYWDSSYSSYSGGYVVVINVSGDNISAGTPLRIDASALYSYCDCTETEPNEVFLVYERSNNAVLYAYLTVSGTTATVKKNDFIASSGHGDGDVFRVIYKDGLAWVLGDHGSTALLYCWIYEVSSSAIVSEGSFRAGADSYEYGADMLLTDDGYIIGMYTYRVRNTGSSTVPRYFTISSLAERVVVATSGITGITVNKISPTKMGKIYVLA